MSGGGGRGGGRRACVSRVAGRKGAPLPSAPTQNPANHKAAESPRTCTKLSRSSILMYVSAPSSTMRVLAGPRVRIAADTDTPGS